MKLKVIKTYSDKYTGETILEGRRISETEERGLELIKAGVAEKIPDKKPKE